jgi:hypothetical protein
LGASLFSAESELLAKETNVEHDVARVLVDA